LTGLIGWIGLIGFIGFVAGIFGIFFIPLGFFLNLHDIGSSPFLEHLLPPYMG
jgi:hypothetical protein